MTIHQKLALLIVIQIGGTAFVLNHYEYRMAQEILDRIEQRCGR